MKYLKIFEKYKFIPPLILLFLVLWTGKGIFTYKFWSTHDGNHHLARSFDAVQTISEGHFPLRWAGTLNFGCGVPIYNFFYPLIYYLIILLNFVFGNIYISYQLANLLPLIFGTIAFYFWAKEETNDILSSFFGALIYHFAPYRFLLIYVRGSPEYLAYGILPLVLLFYSKIFTTKLNKIKYVFSFLAAFLGVLLMISHNFTVMFLTPLILVYLATKLFIKGSTLLEKKLVLGSLFGSFLGSSFFWGPVLLEKQFVKLGTVKTIDFRDHFPTLSQLIRSKWNYFYSGPGVESDGMSFMLGYAQWLLLGIVFVWLVGQLVRNKKNIGKFFISNAQIVIFYFLSIFFIFLILTQSTFIWNMLPILQDIQFPWRLLGILVFTISVFSTLFVSQLKKNKLRLGIICFVSLIAIYGNRNHLLPMPIADNDYSKFSDFETMHEHRYSTTTFGDDILSVDSEKVCTTETPFVSLSGSGKVNFHLIKKGSTFGLVSYQLQNKDENSKVIYALEYFPKMYQFKLNGLRVDYQNCDGKVCINQVQENKVNFLSWKVIQTPTENIFNLVSLFTFLISVLILFLGLYREKINFRQILTRKNIVIAFVFLVFCFLRFYKLPERMGFAWDLERDAYSVSEILKGNLTLLGPRVVGPEGFYLPPYFYYLLSPFYAVFKGSPDALFAFIYVCNIVFFILGFVILKKIFFEKIGLSFLLIWAIHPLMIGFDTTPWNPIMVPFVFLIFLYFIYRFYISRQDRYLFTSSLILGLGISFHVQFLFYGLLLLPFIIDKKAILFLKRIIIIITGIVVTFFPIIVFDLRHGFTNAVLAGKMFFQSSNVFGASMLRVVNNFWSSAFTFNVPKPVSLSVFPVFSFLSFWVAKKGGRESFEKILMRAMAILFALTPLFLVWYKGDLSEYYLIFLLPCFLIALLLFCTKLSGGLKFNRLFFGFVLLLFIITSLLSDYRKVVNIDPKGYRYKKDLVEFLSEITYLRNDFNLSFSVPIGEDSGFHYLIDFNNIIYSGDDRDTLIQITYPAEQNNDTYIIGVYGLKVPDSWLVNAINKN